MRPSKRTVQTDQRVWTIREIEAKDNARIEQIIRECLLEYDGKREGTAWYDPDLCRFSEIYGIAGKRYWIAEDETGTVVGGVGIGPLDGDHSGEQICELQKMYCIPSVRGSGIAHLLLETALDYAAVMYKTCYLETFENMKPAQKFYEKHGFIRTDQTLGDTGHYGCEVRSIRAL